MSDTIELFMWGYQSHFQIQISLAAKEVFSRLDPNLVPKVFLIGLLVEERNDRHPICLEPEDCGYDPKWFHEIANEASHLEAIDEESHLLHSHPVAQEHHEQYLKVKSLQNAFQKALERFDLKKEYVSYCSWPIRVADYMVSTVLQFKRAIFESHYSLTKKHHSYPPSPRQFRVATSLLDAVSLEFLKECSQTLSTPSPGAGLSPLGTDREEVIGAAGKFFMETPEAAAEEFGGRYGLFNECNDISLAKYEGAESKGSMLIVRRGHRNIAVDILLNSPIPINSKRAVRKLLEISSPELSLLTDASHIYGLGHIIGQYNPQHEDLFEVQFTSHYTWDLLHDKRVMMHVSYRLPDLPKPRINESVFKSHIHRIFAEASPQATARLWELTQAAAMQRHGTTVIISKEAAEEAIRLETQSTRIEPIELTNELMQKVTAIDGAVMIDPRANCYAIGVILDGLATQKGDPGRGARYNSAIRYVESKLSENGQYQCIAVIVSEDGSIDLVPSLRPQVRHSQIASTIDKLRELELKGIDGKRFYEVMNWLREHEFYLSQQECEEVNALRRSIESRRKPDTTVYIVQRDLKPNEEMNQSYFFDE